MIHKATISSFLDLNSLFIQIHLKIDIDKNIENEFVIIAFT